MCSYSFGKNDFIFVLQFLQFQLNEDVCFHSKNLKSISKDWLTEINMKDTSLLGAEFEKHTIDPHMSKANEGGFSHRVQQKQVHFISRRQINFRCVPSSVPSRTATDKATSLELLLKWAISALLVNGTYHQENTNGRKTTFRAPCF